MKFALLASALMAQASIVAACYRVHVYLVAEPATNDVVTLQLFWGQDQICVGGANSEFFTDNEEWYSLECDIEVAKYKIAVTENGKKGWVEMSMEGEETVHMDLDLKHHDFSSKCCLETDGGCQANCGQWESCHLAVIDSEDVCYRDNWDCVNCDMRSYCDSV